MSQLPQQPWQEGDTFTNETTGVTYTFDGVKWLASGGDAQITDDLAQEISDREDADTEIKEAALTGILAVDYDMRYQDSQYQIRLDYRLFGEPTLGGKGTAFHGEDSWPIIVDDDLLHFETLVPTDRPELMFKGEKLPAKTKYAFLHFRGERQEWKVSKVEYANGVNRVYGYAVTGNLIVSETAKCDAWFLTEEEALSAPDVPGDLLNLSGETTAFTGVENFQSKGALNYKNASFALGYDVVVQAAQFVANPAGVGLNHDIVPSGRIMWVDQFPVGSTMIIQGAAATLALEVVQSRKSGNNNRAHGFDVNILWQSGAFVDGELLQIGTGDLVAGRRLLLDDVVVGDSGWEDRIATLENRVDYLEAALQPFLPISLGVYPTKMDNYQPTGSTQAEGTATTWWIDVVNNTNPQNHARIGMFNKELSVKVANMPVPFEMDVIQGDLKQTWVIADCYERGAGVLHLLASGGWGDRMEHSVGTAVDTEYVVRKI